MVLIYLLLIWNICMTAICYNVLRKKKVLYDDRFAMTITMVVPMVSSIAIGLHISILVALDLTYIFVLNVFFGMIIGIIFGSLIKFHALLTGIYNGIIGSLMGAMMGEVLKNPQLCSIPLTSKSQIIMNLSHLCLFSTLLLTLVLSFVLYSLKV